MTLSEILDLKFNSDIGESTVRGFLKALLVELWTTGEGFSGKRPFGNSGWESDMYFAFVENGLIPGQIDTEEYEGEIYTEMVSCDYKAGEALVLNLIDHVFD